MGSPPGSNQRHLPGPAAGAAHRGRLDLDQRLVDGGVQAPTGGMKDSGIGRERGLAGIRNYLQIKNVAIRL